jgi:hypothetical protein
MRSRSDRLRAMWSSVARRRAIARWVVTPQTATSAAIIPIARKAPTFVGAFKKSAIEVHTEWNFKSGPPSLQGRHSPWLIPPPDLDHESNPTRNTSFLGDLLNTAGLDSYQFGTPIWGLGSQRQVNIPTGCAVLPKSKGRAIGPTATGFSGPFWALFGASPQALIARPSLNYPEAPSPLRGGRGRLDFEHSQ